MPLSVPFGSANLLCPPAERKVSPASSSPPISSAVSFARLAREQPIPSAGSRRSNSVDARRDSPRYSRRRITGLPSPRVCDNRARTSAIIPGRRVPQTRAMTRTTAPFLILGLVFLSGCCIRARTDAHPAEDHHDGRELEASWSLADFNEGDDARRDEALEKLQQVRASTRNCANLFSYRDGGSRGCRKPRRSLERLDSFPVGSYTLIRT